MEYYSEEEEALLYREDLLEMFKKNIYIIVANEERILSDERLSRVMVPTHIGNCYWGVLYMYSLRSFLWLWRSCPSAVVFDENNEMEFVYACSGGVSGGACWFANKDGVDPIGAGTFPSKYYTDVFGAISKMSSALYKDNFSRSDSQKPYQLEEALHILGMIDKLTCATNLEKYKQQMLKSHQINKRTTLPITYMIGWQPVTLNVHDIDGDRKLEITDRTTEFDVTEFFFKNNYVYVSNIELTEEAKSICLLLEMNPSDMENEEVVKANIIAKIVMSDKDYVGLFPKKDYNRLFTDISIKTRGLEDVIEELKSFCKHLFGMSIRYLREQEEFGFGYDLPF